MSTTVRLQAGVGSCLKAKRLVEQVLYIVTTQGVPLRVKGATGMDGDNASVDSELALLYSDLHGALGICEAPRRILSSGNAMRNFGTRSFRYTWSQGSPPMTCQGYAR